MIHQTAILDEAQLDLVGGGYKRCTTEEGGTGMYNDETCDRLSIGQRWVQFSQLMDRMVGSS